VPRPAQDTSCIAVWRDRGTTGLRPGDDWRREIDDALRNSHIVLVLVTRIARQSEYVTYEWAFALGAGVKVVPIVVDKQALHPRLAAFQYFDINSPTVWDDLVAYIRVFIEEKGLDQDVWVTTKT
jgi:hypothetical protein